MSSEVGDGVDRILAALRERFGLIGVPDGAVLIPSGSRKYRVASEEAAALTAGRVIGVYVVKDTPMGPLLSIEGTQILGPLARKNVLSLPEDLLDDWMRGGDLEIGERGDLEPGLVIVRFGDLFAGCGLYSPPKLRNMVPLSRRISSGGGR